MKVSILIPVKNEISNIADCLKSVEWSDDVVVVDSSSTDGTAAVATQHGARVVNFDWNRRFPKKKNWALETVTWRHEWVLILDADERISPELGNEIQNMPENDDINGYFINRQFLFLGRWLKHCGYYPSWNLRLFRHRLGRYERLHSGDCGSGDNEVHEHVQLSGRSDFLTYEMLHYAYPNIYTWVEKHNRYSNWEACIETGCTEDDSYVADIGWRLALRRLTRELSRKLPFRPALRFIYSYFFKRGFLDGYEGLIFCQLLSFYEALNVFKAYERRILPPPSEPKFQTLSSAQIKEPLVAAKVSPRSIL